MRTKIVLATTAFVMIVSTTIAENPHVGESENLYASDRAPVASLKVDYMAPASISKTPVFHDILSTVSVMHRHRAMKTEMRLIGPATKKVKRKSFTFFVLSLRSYPRNDEVSS